MAYTIAVVDQKTAERFIARLTSRLGKNNRFKVGRILSPELEALRPKALKRGGKPRMLVRLQNILLGKSKPYCGQHPGPCPVDNRPKSKNTYLEWDDWVAFNNLVNGVLDKMKTEAEVWSNPRGEAALHGQSNKTLWIRKDGKRRVRWDWEEDWIAGREIRRWDMGSESQFIKEAA